MKKKFIVIISMCMLMYSITACSSTDIDDAPALSDTSNVNEEFNTVLTPLTEEDVDKLVIGIEDHFVLQDAENIDYLYGISYNTNEEPDMSKIIIDIQADDADINIHMPDMYTIIYTITINRNAYEDYIPLSETETPSNVQTEMIKKSADADINVENNNSYEDVSIIKTITVVDNETADELIAQGTTVWASENKDYTSTVINDKTKISDKVTEDAASSQETTVSDESNNTNINNTEANATSKNDATKTVTETIGSTASSKDSSTAVNNKSTSCDHDWVSIYHDATGHYENIKVKDAYDEKIATGSEFTCKKCGYTTTDGDEINIHCSSCGSGYTVSGIYDTVHHDAVYEQKWIQDSAAYTTYKCSKCGATK